MKPRQPPRTRSEERCQVQQAYARPGRCGEMSAPDLRPTQAEVFLLRKADRMSARTELQGVRDSLRAGRQLRLRELLRPARGRLRPLRAGRRPRPSGRSRRARSGIWRYADFLPFEGAPRRPAGAGPDAAGPGRPARRAARARRRALDQERRRQPDPLVQGPRRRRGGRQGAGARLRDRRLRLHRQPRQRRRRPRRRGRPRLLRLRPRRPRGAEAARHRHLRHQPGRRPRQLRRRQPALHRARPDPALGLRQRQPAPLLRRGLEDARLRDGRAARLGAARPGRLPDRLGVALHQARPRLPGVARARPGRRRAADLQRRPGATAARPVATAFAEGWDVCKPQKPDTIAKSLAIGDPADGPYALELARRTGGAIDSVTDDEIRAGIRCSPRRPGSSPRPPAG